MTRAPRSTPAQRPEHPVEMLNATYSSPEPAPWDIGRPQPPFAQLVDAGGLIGDVLDVGCGTGEHALLAAAHGHTTLGIDLAARAIELANEKAVTRGIEVAFRVFDALDLAALGMRFDTVTDCGLFHGLDDRERERFVDGLAQVLRPGGRYQLLCFSDREPGDWGPRRITQSELRTCFARDWVVDAIEPAVLDLTIPPGCARAWLATITRSKSRLRRDAGPAQRDLVTRQVDS